jgi:carbamoyl-phosphate synthase small subunit
MRWAWPEGYRRQTGPRHRVVAIDYGAKRNILRCLASAGCDVTVLPATADAEDVLALSPDGVFLSNGPGDPAATGEYAVPMIRACWSATCRSSASAWATRCWRWRWGRRR